MSAARRWQAQQLLFPEPGRAKLKVLPGIRERDIAAPLKKLLEMHPKVAIASRMNTGAGYLVSYVTMQNLIAELGGKDRFESLFGKVRWIEFGTPGCSDYLGLMRDGRMLALEVKAQKYVPSQVSEEQRSFLALVNAHGGLGFVGSSVSRIEAILSGREAPEDPGHGYLV